MFKRIILGPYKNTPLSTSWSRRSTILWREEFNSTNIHTINYFHMSPQRYYSAAGEYNTLDEAIYATDKWLQNKGYILVSEEKFNSLKVLL